MLQVLLAGIWLAGLPVAIVPLWQLKHSPTTWAWSTRVAGFQAPVAWQLSQLSVVLIWFAGLPVAIVPLWQLAQPDTTPP